MTSDLDLYGRFANVAYPEPPTVNNQFGKLEGLASWLVATGLSNRDGRTLERELVLFSQDKSEHDLLHHPTDIKISRHSLSTIESTEESIERGAQIADRAIDSGMELLFLATQRIRENHDLEILIGALTRSDAASVTSRQGVTDQEWMANAAYVRDEIFALRDLIADPPALLAHTRSIDVAAMVGVILQSANRATPLVIIGDGAHCAALLATRIAHLSREWLLPATDLTSQVGVMAQRHLNRQPILELAMNFDRDYQTPIAMTAPVMDAMLALL